MSKLLVFPVRTVGDSSGDVLVAHSLTTTQGSMSWVYLSKTGQEVNDDSEYGCSNRFEEL